MTAAELARFGGTPACDYDDVRRGFGRWPVVGHDEIDAVVRVLTRPDEPWGLLHPDVIDLQESYRSWVGRDFCQAVGSGTAALHLALAALDVTPGDEVIVPALGYVATAVAAMHHNCVPVFADVDPSTFNLTADTIAAAITPRTAAVIAVDLHGLPAPFGEIEAVCLGRGLGLVEDASQAQGAQLDGRRAGAFGDVAAVSIMPTKNLPGGGEGGLVTCDDPVIASNVRGLVSQGMDPWDPAPGRARRVSRQLGFNYRPTPTSAAFARQQLRTIDHHQARRLDNVARFERQVPHVDWIRRPFVPDGAIPAWQMYRMLVDPQPLGLPHSMGGVLRDAFVLLLRAEHAVVSFWDFQILPSMPVFLDRVGYGVGCPWTCHGHDHGPQSPADFPNAIRSIERYLMPHIARSTHTDDYVDGQAVAFTKVIEHVDVVVALAERIDRAGGFEAFAGCGIADVASMARLRLRWT